MFSNWDNGNGKRRLVHSAQYNNYYYLYLGTKYLSLPYNIPNSNDLFADDHVFQPLQVIVDLCTTRAILYWNSCSVDVVNHNNNIVYYTNEYHAVCCFIVSQYYYYYCYYYTYLILLYSIIVDSTWILLF